MSELLPSAEYSVYSNKLDWHQGTLIDDEGILFDFRLAHVLFPPGDGDLHEILVGKSFTTYVDGIDAPGCG